MTEKTVLTKARGLYRWERGEGWPKTRNQNSLCTFERGQAITIDPFRNLSVKKCNYFHAIYGTFKEYVTDDIARVYIPPASENDNCWFKEGEGEYLIHEGYLTPQ
mgnify:CR=1 FL=1